VTSYANVDPSHKWIHVAISNIDLETTFFPLVSDFGGYLNKLSMDIVFLINDQSSISPSG
jgi:hypothetical protein